MQSFPLLTAALAFIVLPGLADAQVRGQSPRDRVQTIIRASDEERPVIGVNTASSGPRDTLGLLIVGVTPGGPAERAGIEEGFRIAEINGVSLRLASADAGEDDMQGLTTRRLIRELRKVNAGAEVDLRVYANGQLRNIKVKTIAAEDLPSTRRVSSQNEEKRAVLGLSLNPSGSRRDTLGVLITQVTTDGPAEKAGLIEGDRIASINGVDLRVPSGEAGEVAISNAKSNRFTREMRKLKAGEEVELRVYSAGQFKNARIKTLAAEDVYDSQRGWSYFFGRSEAPRVEIGPGSMTFPRVPGETFQFTVPEAPTPPAAPMPPGGTRYYRLPAPLPPTQLELEDDGRTRSRSAMTSVSYTADASAPTGRSFARQAPQPPASQAMGVGEQQRIPQIPASAREQRDPGDPQTSGVVVATGVGEQYTLELPGLQLAKIGADLAEYLGSGTERGLLVVEVDDIWTPLRIGDVVLSVNGRPVRAGDAAAVALDTAGENVVEIVRRGRRATVRVDCR